MAKISIIGCGNLGKAIVKSSIYSGTFKGNIKASINTAIKLKSVKEETGINMVETSNKNLEVIKDSDYVILCVKPTQVKSVLIDIGAHLGPGQILISTAAGVDLKYIKRFVGVGHPIIRCMPNLSISLGTGVVGIYSDNVKVNDLNKMITRVFKDSLVLYLDREDKMDAITTISGCGPAFFSYFAKQIYYTGKSLGLTEMESSMITKHTLYGTGSLLYENSFDDVITKVASKGGATEAGLENMTNFKLNHTIDNSIHESYRRIKNIKHKLEE